MKIRVTLNATPETLEHWREMAESVADDPWHSVSMHNVLDVEEVDELEEEETRLRLSFSVSQQIAAHEFSERIRALRASRPAEPAEPSTK